MITSRSNPFGCDGGRRAAHPTLRPNRRTRGLPLACRLALAFAFLTVAALADGAGASFPRTDTQLGAQLDDANWILPAKTYAGNQVTDTLFVAPGNPGPDFVATKRMGKNLYTNSLVALDISGARPKIKWYYQLVQNDTHDGNLSGGLGLIFRVGPVDLDHLRPQRGALRGVCGVC
jgi:hypothetical protein